MAVNAGDAAGLLSVRRGSKVSLIFDGGGDGLAEGRAARADARTADARTADARTADARATTRAAVPAPTLLL